MRKIKQQHKFGWIPDLPSQVPWFDHERLMARLGKTPDFTEWWKLVFWCNDQGNEGSCTANAGVTAERLFRVIRKMHDVDLARQFLYNRTCMIEGHPRQDTGASIADTVEAEMEFGVCLEKYHPYSTPLSRNPSTTAVKNALTHQVLKKQPVRQTQAAIEACLAAGQPLQFGFTVYPSFESPIVQRTGIVPMPTKADLRAGPLGGHAQCGCDYDRRTKQLFTLNSWGKKSGLNGIGLFKFPISYVLDGDLSSDFWTFSEME